MLYVISILFHSNRRIPTSIDGIQNFYNTMLSGCLTSLPPAPYSQKHTNDSHCNRDLNYHFDLLVTNNKGCECKNGKRCKGKKGTKQGYSSRAYVLPSWIGLGLFRYKPKELQVPSSVSMQGMIHTMIINLNKNGQFQSMRRIQWDKL